MSWKTPHVEGGVLRECDVAATVKLDTPAWFDWLADDHHRCFHFAHAAGDFTARKERKQRGQWYWVAYRQMHRRLYKTYLGKTDCLTEQRLKVAATELAHAEHRATEEVNNGEPQT